MRGTAARAIGGQFHGPWKLGSQVRLGGVASPCKHDVIHKEVCMEADTMCESPKATHPCACTCMCIRIPNGFRSQLPFCSPCRTTNSNHAKTRTPMRMGIMPLRYAGPRPICAGLDAPLVATPAHKAARRSMQETVGWGASCDTRYFIQISLLSGTSHRNTW